MENSLKFVNGRYEMDYDQLEQIAKRGAKILLLCSPHNPVDRIWKRDELLRLEEICTRYEKRCNF